MPKTHRNRSGQRDGIFFPHVNVCQERWCDGSDRASNDLLQCEGYRHAQNDCDRVEVCLAQAKDVFVVRLCDGCMCLLFVLVFVVCTSVISCFACVHHDA